MNIINIILFYDSKTFNEKLSNYHINLFLKKSLSLVNLIFNYLELPKFRNRYYLTFTKRDLQNFRNELIKYNNHNLNYLPIIHVEILIHSINNNKELSETIKSIDRLKFSRINVKKYLLHKTLSHKDSISELCSGDLKNNQNKFLFFLTSGTQIRNSFFFDLYRSLAKNNFKANLIYFNEITLSSPKKYNCKPAFSPDYLENKNYIGKNFVIRKIFESDFKVLKKDNNFHKFILNISTKINNETIVLINKFLLKNKLANRKAKISSLNDFKNTIKSYHKNLGIKSSVNLFNNSISIDYINFTPFVSIIIPASGNVLDGKDLLMTLLDSIFKRTNYSNYEIIIIDHDDLNSKHTKFIDKYDFVKRIKLNKIKSKSDFNFSKNCNVAAKHSNGEYLLFLNDDMKVINSSWLKNLVGHFSKKHTGVVGGKLLYPNNNIQHAGVALLNGCPGHLYENQPHDYSDSNFTKNLSAVTGACLMIKREDFDLLGGFDENIFKSNYSDTDLCLRTIYELGKYVIYEPKCMMYHFASVSRSDAFNVPQDILVEFKKKYGFLVYDKFHSLYYDTLELNKINSSNLDF